MEAEGTASTVHGSGPFLNNMLLMAETVIPSSLYAWLLVQCPPGIRKTLNDVNIGESVRKALISKYPTKSVFDNKNMYSPT